MRMTLRGLAVSTSVTFLAVGCGPSNFGLNTDGSSGSGSSVGGSGGQGNGQNGGVSGIHGDGAVSGVGGLRGSGGGTSTTADGGASPDSMSTTRVPTNHRPTMTSCPQERGPGISTSSGTGGNCTQMGCLQDSDCTSGMNGRCLGGPFACSGGCTYDDCLSDADCPANVPCGCRSSGSEWLKNFCATQSNCRIDADCGSDGYCSPSLLSLFQQGAGYTICDDWASGYFCHTPNDRCTDDSDCNEGTCDFNLTSQSWSCGLCLPPL